MVMYFVPFHMSWTISVRGTPPGVPPGPPSGLLSGSVAPPLPDAGKMLPDGISDKAAEGWVMQPGLAGGLTSQEVNLTHRNWGTGLVDFPCPASLLASPENVSEKLPVPGCIC